MKHCKSLFVASLFLVAACGDDSSSSQPDAAPDGTTGCVGTAGEITTYPGTFSGTVIGGGADLTAAEGACTVQTGDQWYDPAGEDVVVRLGGLTAGSTYVVQLTTEDDLSFYVTTGCPPASGAVTGCLNFTDTSYMDESGTFVATGAEHYLVIDHLVDAEFPLTTGMFTIDAVEAACTPETEATDCAAPTPFCIDYQCVACSSTFDCSMTTPVCSAEGACVAGPTTCTGDDTRDTTGSGDDGPAAATTIDAPGATTPTVITDGAICNSPTSEADWFKVVLPANDIGIELTFTGATNDLDVYLLTEAGAVVVSGESNAGINEAIRTTDLVAGTYYVVVTQYKPDMTVAAVPYTLTLRRAECTDDFDCTVATAPVCGGAGVCGAGPALCAGDDLGEGNDDGPAGARLLVTGVPLTGSICSSPASEVDYFRVVVADGQSLAVSLSWTGATIDLDPVVQDATGRSIGFSYYKNPENVALTYLPGGTYYIRVSNFAQTASTTSTAYTLTATAGAAQNCTTSADCAAVYETQLYRGLCDTTAASPTLGSCLFIPAGAGAEGAACDSADDCTGNRCSYVPFDADAESSKCTKTCTTSADCASLGTTPAFTCTAGLQTNFCVPGCATDVECGANTGSATPDANLPWNYLTCTPATNVCSI